MSLQVPGSFLLVISLYSTPGSNWTSYVSYLISGVLQAALLSVCLVLNFKKSGTIEEEDPLLQNEDDASEAGTMDADQNTLVNNQVLEINQ